MEEVLNGLGYCNLNECESILISLKQRISILKERERLVKQLTGKSYQGHAAVQRDREKSGFGQ